MVQPLFEQHRKPLRFSLEHSIPPMRSICSLGNRRAAPAPRLAPTTTVLPATRNAVETEATSATQSEYLRPLSHRDKLQS